MNTIRKILVGKLFRFYPYGELLVIVGVRKNSFYGYIEILVGKVYYSNITIYSWYGYNQKSLCFEGRDSKENIKYCLKTRPDKIKFHVGKSININDCNFVHDNRFTHYYREYLNSIE
jgi:hypothetical protein